MNNQAKKLISLAISGLIAGGVMTSTAFANEDAHEEGTHEEGKDSCKGKEGCKGKEEHKDGDHHE